MEETHYANHKIPIFVYLGDDCTKQLCAGFIRENTN